jgi:hypothetical protein
VSKQIFSAIRQIAFYEGAGSRIRTDDLLITNQLLYQLSYAGIYEGKLLSFTALSRRIVYAICIRWHKIMTKCAIPIRAEYMRQSLNPVLVQFLNGNIDGPILERSKYHMLSPAD